MSKAHEKIRLRQTNSPMEKGLRMARKAVWILLVPLVAGAGVVTCCEIAKDVKAEMKLRAEKSETKNPVSEIECPANLQDDELDQLLNVSETPKT